MKLEEGLAVTGVDHIKTNTKEWNKLVINK